MTKRLRKAAAPTPPTPSAPAALSAPLGEIGLSGLKRFGGFVFEEFLPKLQGTRANAVYTEMQANDPVVKACLTAIVMLCRQADRRIEYDPEDAAEREAGEFVESCFNDMSQSFEDTLAEILSMLGYGWSWHEVVYKRREGRNGATPSQYDDGRIGWRKWGGRAQSSWWQWQFDDQGGIVGMQQRAAPDYQIRTLPITRSLLFRPSLYKNNPEGASLLRSAYRPWYFKKRIEEIEAIGIERDLAGLPVLYAPGEYLNPDAPDSYKAVGTRLKQIVQGIRRDEQEGVLLPDIRDDKGNRLLTLELLASGGKREFDTTAIITRYDQRIAMTMLADFVLLGHEKVGSFALADSKTDVFGLAVAGWLQSIEAVINQHAIPRLLEVNNLTPPVLPKFKFGDVESPDLATLGEFIAKLTASGMQFFPDPALENQIRRDLKFPELTDEQLEERERQAELDEEMKRAEAEALASGATAGRTDAAGRPIPAKSSDSDDG